jgi:hypothetical protein
MILCLAIQPSLGVSQWIATVGTDSEEVFTVFSNGSYLFAGDYLGAYRSSDHGMTWTLIDSGLVKLPLMTIGPGISGFVFRNGKMYAGGDNGLYVTTNSGTNWTPCGSLPHSAGIGPLLSCGSSLIAAGGWMVSEGDGDFLIEGELFRSTDDGATWSTSSTGMPSNPIVSQLAALPNTIVASTGTGIYVSKDSGLTWNKSSPYPSLSNIYRIAACDSLLVAVSRGPLSLSTDGGTTWTLPAGDSTFLDPTAMCIVRNTLVVTSLDSGVTVSTDWGISWKRVNDGLDTTGSFSTRFYVIGTLAPVGDYMFAGSSLHLWRRPLSEITRTPITSSAPVPSGYSLEQNFPNPFNPTTEITYKVPTAGYTSLEVFDALGRRLTTLVSRFLKPGVYSSKWDASATSSGVYIYRLHSGSYNSARKMILIK